MKYAIGYQQTDGGEAFMDIVDAYRDHLAEVYFAWPSMPSGRAPLGTARGYSDWTVQSRLEDDLKSFRSRGIGLSLLFNASCYGKYAASEYLANNVMSIIDHLNDIGVKPDSITTLSPMIAHVVSGAYPGIEVRASINMKVGEIAAMAYISDTFDGFYVQREYNRDLNHLRRLKSWADANGKKLYLLANSGCLAHCPGQTFHDNMVSHETEIDETRNLPGFTPYVCWNHFKNPDNRATVLKNTWIRPEDIHHYDGLFDMVKLATRQHANPRLVVQAYASEKFYGNLLDLFEPGFAPAFAPAVIDNTAFPDDWFEKTSTCGRRCESCRYCESVLEKTLVNGGASHTGSVIERSVPEVV